MSKLTFKAVFPAKAGNQPYYEVRSPLYEELDTRMREYDGSTYDETA